LVAEPANVGALNSARAVGDPRALRINEWLAASQPPYPDDFVELYNPQGLPVSLGGLHLTDQPLGSPTHHTIPALSFVAANGSMAFIADGDESKGADHLNFRLAYETGEIGLADADGVLLDSIIYGPQAPGVSFGRCPDGALAQRTLDDSHTCSPNACPATPPPPQVVTLLNITNSWRYENSGTDLGTGWLQPGFDDDSWPSGQALLAVENCNCLPEPSARRYRWPMARSLSISARISIFLPTLNISQLELSHVLDDGAIVYLNGVEVYRNNMPAGAVTFTTQATSTVGDATYQGPFPLPLDSLLPGDNVIAVEVHQIGQNSTDIVFGLRLDGVTVTNTPALAGGSSSTKSWPTTPLSRSRWQQARLRRALQPVSSPELIIAEMSLTDSSLVPRRWVFPNGSYVPAQGYFRARLDGNRPPPPPIPALVSKPAAGRFICSTVPPTAAHLPAR
jgi:hypothetical protein